jgi:hypothetical protein
MCARASGRVLVNRCFQSVASIAKTWTWLPTVEQSKNSGGAQGEVKDMIVQVSGYASAQNAVSLGNPEKPSGSCRLVNKDRSPVADGELPAAMGFVNLT